MIKKISCQAIIEGDRFTPDILFIPQTIRVIRQNKKGDVIKSGRYKGDTSSEGLLIVEGTIDDISEFIMLEIFSQFSRELVELNFCLLVSYEGECNFELTPQQLEIITTLKIPLAISCYSGG